MFIGLQWTLVVWLSPISSISHNSLKKLIKGKRLFGKKHFVLQVTSVWERIVKIYSAFLMKIYTIWTLLIIDWLNFKNRAGCL